MPWFSAVAKAAGRRIRAQSGLQGRSWQTRSGAETGANAGRTGRQATQLER
jgi:hypothetical protein